MLIVLAAITVVVVYGNIQHNCSSTYDLNRNITLQYNNTINCSMGTNKCNKSIDRFFNASALTTNQLLYMINNGVFKFDPNDTNVSFNDRHVYIIQLHT